MKQTKNSHRGILLSVSFLSGIGLLMAGQGTVDGFLGHSAFLVKEVEVRWPAGTKGKPSQFRLSPPSSVFRIELGGLAQALEKRYPLYEVKGVERVLPNRIRATLSARRIVGQVRANKSYYLVSDDGTLLAPGAAVPRPTLPVLILEDFKRPARGGIASTEFWQAAELLNSIRREGGIAGQRVSTVRVSGDDLFVTLSSQVELRFSSQGISAEWQRLGNLLRQRPGVLTQAKYIDLRFDDPVIAENKKPKKKKR